MVAAPVFIISLQHLGIMFFSRVDSSEFSLVSFFALPLILFVLPRGISNERYLW